MAKALGERFMQLMIEMPRKTSFIRSAELW